MDLTHQAFTSSGDDHEHYTVRKSVDGSRWLLRIIEACCSRISLALTGEQFTEFCDLQWWFYWEINKTPELDHCWRIEFYTAKITWILHIYTIIPYPRKWGKIILPCICSWLFEGMIESGNLISHAQAMPLQWGACWLVYTIHGISCLRKLGRTASLSLVCPSLLESVIESINESTKFNGFILLFTQTIHWALTCATHWQVN